MSLRLAEVVLDNAELRAPGGVRSLDGDGRQLVFRHGGLQVELMLQTGRAGPVVWGKVLREASGQPCAGARTTLLDRLGAASAETRTDDWGEFWLATGGEPHGDLRVGLGPHEFLCSLAGRARARAEEPVLG